MGKLATCCSTGTVTCTCADHRCCAEALQSPARLELGESNGIGLTFVSPLVVHISGRARWYYYLSYGPLPLPKLRTALDGSFTSIRKGYRIGVPSISALEEVFTMYPELEIRSGAPALKPTHFWSSSFDNNGDAWAVRQRLGDPVVAYASPADQSKHLFLEITEVFTVAHASRLRRVVIEEGVACCYTSDISRLSNVPRDLLGATFFVRDHPEDQVRKASKFVVSTSLPVTIFAVAAIDPYNKHQGRYKSGFETLGWEAVPVSGFLLTPLAVHMGCWRRKLAAGDTLEVPHWSGLFGSIAVKVASS